MTKFIKALFDLKLVSQESLNQMKQESLNQNLTTIRGGYGWGMETFKIAGKTLYGHTGAIDNSGAWLAYLPEEKLSLAYTSNGKVYPVDNIVSGVFDIYWNKPFQIPAFDTIEVSQEVLDQYVGVYSSPSAPVKCSVTRSGATLVFQVTGQPAVALEATAQDKFKIGSADIVIEFNAAKNQVTIKRSRGERVFTKEK